MCSCVNTRGSKTATCVSVKLRDAAGKKNARMQKGPVSADMLRPALFQCTQVPAFRRLCSMIFQIAKATRAAVPSAPPTARHGKENGSFMAEWLWSSTFPLRNSAGGPYKKRRVPFRLLSRGPRKAFERNTEGARAGARSLATCRRSGKFLGFGKTTFAELQRGFGCRRSPEGLRRNEV